MDSSNLAPPVAGSEPEWDALDDSEAAAADWCSSPGPKQDDDESCPAHWDNGGGFPAAEPQSDTTCPPTTEHVSVGDCPAAVEPDSALQLEVASGRLGYVWSAAAARQLRQLGVTGQPAGSVARAPRQPAQLGLPLTLLPEEMDLLHRQGLAELVQYPELLRPRSADQRRALAQREAASAAAQQRLMTLTRHKQLLERADQIVEGKWRKLERLRAAGKPAPDVSREQLRFEFIEQLRADVRPPPVGQCHQQLYCGHPLTLRPERVPPPPPPTADPAARTRRAVYADLWRRGYWLTDGLKFGGHFLAYEGDPLVYHAAFVVRCVQRRPHVRDLAGMQRLAHGCSKTLLISWVDDGEVRHEAISRRRRPLREVMSSRAGTGGSEPPQDPWWLEVDGSRESKLDGCEQSDASNSATVSRDETEIT
ncbi:tRNA-splicing endonuclease subunit Sen34-like isoform X1 [Amphibalanus amphitrite]|nr:tRNA-splicing endonuclease subunit Sen34-like isoform X2 [Amphibalanus amphitrite]XP_043241558.1 tRNA-splicing endonuclease subunit Sen34-like isoform X2 [Amphibalanus amphitrite]XP_043243249.1 tRNA-splicing endonuclease subunit Sen34-like isoform X1 [Amphibalanus amphitrite]XP_043243250.1 tRNA-splicing endonuclease subunit Sen34-like isoform X1 [Amphibalanus amphitrite]XP_043243252.1 tRNA-splicing endonuclease subunit Sen34-like isoform X1 [Amphibalanus amphitrite]XP_043243253.1 tRNA-splic